MGGGLRVKSRVVFLRRPYEAKGITKEEETQLAQPSVRQSVSPSALQSVSPSFRQSPSLSVCQSVSPSVRQLQNCINP